MHLIGTNIPSNKHFKVFFCHTTLNIFSLYVYWTFDAEILDKSAQTTYSYRWMWSYFYISLISKITQPKRYVTQPFTHILDDIRIWQIMFISVVTKKNFFPFLYVTANSISIYSWPTTCIYLDSFQYNIKYHIYPYFDGADDNNDDMRYIPRPVPVAYPNMVSCT